MAARMTVAQSAENGARQERERIIRLLSERRDRLVQGSKRWQELELAIRSIDCPELAGATATA
jgi:hypothetical protein